MNSLFKDNGQNFIKSASPVDGPEQVKRQNHRSFRFQQFSFVTFQRMSSYFKECQQILKIELIHFLKKSEKHLAFLKGMKHRLSILDNLGISI